MGSHEIQKIVSLDEKLSKDEVLKYAASVQQHSEHHIAHGILNKAKQENLVLWPLENFSYIQGVGVKGTIDNKEVISAGPNYFRQNNQPVPQAPASIDQDIETINYLLIDSNPVAIFTLADTIRESSAQAIEALHQMGIRCYLLTGDNESIARSVSEKLGMDGYFANVLPHEKQEVLKSFQRKGKVVAMTGDGVNDAPALAQADVGIAIGSGTDVAAETADIILVNSDPKDVVNMISYAKATYRKMIQNLAWAVGYNVIAIPLAAGVLHPQFVLSPAMGAVLMSLSTVIVAINAQLLKRKFGN
jgi:P-type Cu2+ transporter